jgi:WD40 repeat protein
LWVERQEILCDYGKIHDHEIDCLETSRESKWLITGSRDREVKIISVDNRETDKDFGLDFDNSIQRMKITADDEVLLAGD